LLFSPGGAASLLWAGGEVALSSVERKNISRLLAFRLNSKASLPPLPQFHSAATQATKVHRQHPHGKNGEALFQRFCSPCHGDRPPSAVASSRISATRPRSTTISGFEIVLKGQLKQAGMVSFDKNLSHDDAAAIRAYVIFPRQSKHAAVHARAEIARALTAFSAPPRPRRQESSSPPPKTLPFFQPPARARTLSKLTSFAPAIPAAYRSPEAIGSNLSCFPHVTSVRHPNTRQALVQPLRTERGIPQNASHRVAIVHRQLVGENLPQRIFTEQLVS